MWPIPETGRGGIRPPPPVLTPGSALGSRPRVALSSAQVASVYRRALGRAKALSLAWAAPPSSRHRFGFLGGPDRRDPAEFRAAMASATAWRGPSGPRFPAMFRQQAMSGCSSAEPYPLACEGFCGFREDTSSTLLLQQIVDRRGTVAPDARCRPGRERFAQA